MNKTREVRELQFSSTQLIVLFLAILILGIFIFLLGVSVGKKQTRLTQEANLIGKPAYETLKRAVPVVPKETEPSAIDKEIATHAKQSGASKTPNQPLGTESMTPASKDTTSVLPQAKPAGPGTKTGSTASPLSKRAQNPAAVKPKSGNALTTAVPKTTAKPLSATPKTTTSRVKTVQSSAQQTKPSGQVKGFYYIQLAAFDERRAAETFMAGIKATGFPALVLDPLATDKKPWFRVRVGGFATKEEAESMVPRLRAAVTTRKFEYWITRD